MRLRSEDGVQIGETGGVARGCGLPDPARETRWGGGPVAIDGGGRESGVGRSPAGGARCHLVGPVVRWRVRSRHGREPMPRVGGRPGHRFGRRWQSFGALLHAREWARGRRGRTSPRGAPVPQADRREPQRGGVGAQALDTEAHGRGRLAPAGEGGPRDCRSGPTGLQTCATALQTCVAGPRTCATHLQSCAAAMQSCAAGLRTGATRAGTWRARAGRVRRAQKVS